VGKNKDRREHKRVGAPFYFTITAELATIIQAREGFSVLAKSKQTTTRETSGKDQYQYSR
jgi:hypothetical protein